MVSSVPAATAGRIKILILLTGYRQPLYPRCSRWILRHCSRLSNQLDPVESATVGRMGILGRPVSRGFRAYLAAAHRNVGLPAASWVPTHLCISVRPAVIFFTSSSDHADPP